MLFLVLLIIAAGICDVANVSPASAAASPACYGSVACAGQNPTTQGCTGTQLESLFVTGLGTLQLFESSVCDTAWAVMDITQTAYPNYPGEAVSNGTGMLIAEILYEPPEGGVEQYNTVPWDGVEAPADEIVTTDMVPMTGSFKACAGSPNATGDPFDMDPQGSTEFVQNPNAGSTQGSFSLGGCTLWH